MLRRRIYEIGTSPLDASRVNAGTSPWRGGRRLSSVVTVTALLLAAVIVPVLLQGTAAAANEVDLRVLLIGGLGGAASDPTTAAWAAGLTNQGVPYTEVDATGTLGAGTESVALPALTSSSTHGLYNAVVFADSPAYFPATQLAPLFSYESTFGIRQIDGYLEPTAAEGMTDLSAGALAETATLNTQGLLDFPALAGPVPLDSGTYGYPSTVATGLPTGASETPLLIDPSGDVLMGIYQHPSAVSDPSDPQAGVQELAIDFDYAATYTQWLLLGPGLIDWVTRGMHLGLYRNYVEMDIDDTFTPDDSWNTTTHTIDYADTDALRMQPSDVTFAAQWSATNDFRMDQLFNFGSSVAAQDGDLVYDGSASAPTTSDPLLAAFQATDPATGRPYSDDFGWISHTYDTPYLDVGCATENYIEAELDENTSSIAATPGQLRAREASVSPRAMTPPCPMATRIPRCLFRATTRASPTSCRATPQPSTHPTSTPPQPGRPPQVPSLLAPTNMQ